MTHASRETCTPINGGISNVINDTGGATSIHPHIDPKVTDYPKTRTISH